MTTYAMRIVSVSIIISIYNIKSYIESCLRSVAAQTFQGETECILVDDCSTDGSMELVDKFIKAYSGPIHFVIYHRLKNGGVSSVRNDGIRLAKGDYIFFLDGDDEITPDCLDHLTRSLSEQDVDMVIGDYEVIESKKHYPSPSLNDGEILMNSQILHAYQHAKWYIMAWNKLYRKEFLDSHDIRFEEGIIHEDELWSFEVAALAKKVQYVGRKTYLYRVREGSIMTTLVEEKSARNMVVVLQKTVKFSADHKLRKGQDLHNVIQRFLLRTLILLYKANMMELFDETYREFRKCYSHLFSYSILGNILHPRIFIRDMHLLFPISLGLHIEKSIVRVFAQTKRN